MKKWGHLSSLHVSFRSYGPYIVQKKYIYCNFVRASARNLVYESNLHISPLYLAMPTLPARAKKFILPARKNMPFSMVCFNLQAWKIIRFILFLRRKRVPSHNFWFHKMAQLVAS